MKKESLPFTVEETTSLPPQVGALTEKLAGFKSGRNESIVVDGRTYMILTLGERPTGGYRITVSKVEQRGQTIHVYAEEKPPAEGAIVIQVITHPYTVISIKGHYMEHDIRFHIAHAFRHSHPSQ